MAVKTYAEQLQQVQEAIYTIETKGQKYQIEDGNMRRELWRGDLKALYEREQFLRAMVEREANGGGLRLTYAVLP